MKDLLEKIKHHEGYRKKTYKCTEGYDTIGIGFAWKDLEFDKELANKILQDNKHNIELSEEICYKVLEEKIDAILGRLQKVAPWVEESNKVIQMVIINMCYQMGVSGVMKFKKALKAMQDGNWEKAADEMLDSKWARQTSDRAIELSNIVRSLHEKESSKKGNSNT